MTYTPFFFGVIVTLAAQWLIMFVAITIGLAVVSVRNAHRKQADDTTALAEIPHNRQN